MSPRPPSFNRVFDVNARHDFSGFRSGCVVTVRITEGTDLRLPTGRLVASEPGALFGHDAGDFAFVQRVPPGTYPVELIMADFHDPGNPQGNTRFSEVAAARLRVRDEPIAAWQMALQPGQDDAELGDDEYFGYPVDGGTGSFASPEASNALTGVYDSDPDDFFAVTAEIFETDDAVSYADEETGANMVMFRSGGGDGRYGTWVGYTAAGEVGCFVTDFGTLTAHADADECGYCETGPQGTRPTGSAAQPTPVAPAEPTPPPVPAAAAAPLHPLSGPASHATGSTMLVGQSLRRQSLTSPSGTCTLVHQDDGNLVLYRYDLDSAVWASNTYGTSVGEFVLQADGNLVLYDRDGRAVWATGTDGRPAARLFVRDEGTLVLEAADGSELWSAGHPISRTARIPGAPSRGVPAKAAVPAAKATPAVPKRPGTQPKFK